MTKLRERSSRNVFHAHKREDFSFATEMGRDNDASAGKPKGCRDSRNQEHNRGPMMARNSAVEVAGTARPWVIVCGLAGLPQSGSVPDRLGHCPGDRVVR